jgi:RNA-splicing ligase RtcB
MVYHFLDNPMFEGAKIRIMPDVHAGKDIVVGFTVPFTDHVNPDHVGGDIGCSVSTAITDLPICPEDYAQIEKYIRENVKFGMTIQPKAVYPYAELYKHLQLRLQQARQQWPEMVGAMDVSERGITAMLKRLAQKESMFYNSIGTVGGGNHFVEVGETPEGNYAFTVHCGSRNLGQMVWKYWKMEANKQTGMTNGFLVGEAMKGYITDMVVAQAYAEFNHQVIDRLVLEAISQGSGKNANIVEQIYTTHNYIDFSMKMMRKGAVAAPAGRKLVIPFNMRDGLIIARGKGNVDWNQSAPHGAGRLLSRSDAKVLIDLEEYRESMKGIYSTSVGTGTIDESPMAYKDPMEILRLIEDTVEVEYFIRPVINLKATSSYDSSVELDLNEEQD